MGFSRAYQQLKNLYHFFQAHAWRIWYGRPDRDLKFYGITGTNGKTTTAYLFDSILAEHVGRDRVGLLTTVAMRVGAQEKINETKLTTLPSRLVYQYLRQMKKAGISHVVIEMTSHALDQNRLAGITLDGAVILNIEREHLDYHRTMEAYAQAKGKIISCLKPSAPLVYKSDNKWVRQALKKLQLTAYNSQLTAFTAQHAQSVRTPLEGQANKENALAASLLAQAVSVPQSTIDKGIAAVAVVPGRMEWIDSGRGFRILVDYAVTPDALERLYQYVRSITSGNVLAVLGAAGLRDRGKRPAMARAVAKFADELVLTREDPWGEPEEQIFEDLEHGLQGTAIKRQRIVDRKDAIHYLLQRARIGDVVVVTGKGAETGMAIGNKIVPWNDKKVIEQLLRELPPA
jgi:UDP-N-acetylmuramoyl-L-alanyl-D-glutamate--2,6-diaminopimelate ligase